MGEPKLDNLKLVPETNPEEVEKDAIQKADQLLRKKMNSLEASLRMLGLNEDSIEENAKQHKPIDSQIQTEILAVIDTALACENFYIALHYLKLLGLEDRIREQIAGGIHYRKRSNKTSVYLLRGTMEYGNEEQKDEALSEYFKDVGFAVVDSVAGGYFTEKMANFQKAFDEYTRINGLPGVPVYPALLNSAFDLKKEGYHLAIGIMKSGAPLAVLLEFIGQKTRYAEWHGNWRRGPIWRKIGKETELVKKAQRILVCEELAENGTTLEALKPLLQNLQPSEVDVHFLFPYAPGRPDSSDIAVKNSGFYNKSFHRDRMPADNFLKYFREAQAMVHSE